MSDAHKPLTALDLADALSCFWNAAIGAAHERQEGFDTANIMVSGFSAVEQRLREIDSATPGPRDALIKEQAAEITRLRASISAYQSNGRATYEALVAMRNSINEYIPMPSIESDLLQGPEYSVFCETVATCVVTALKKSNVTASQIRAEALREAAAAVDCKCPWRDATLAGDRDNGCPEDRCDALVSHRILALIDAPKVTP